MIDHRYPEEVTDNGIKAQMKRTTCKTCSHCYLEIPNRIAHICSHPNMRRRFDVTPFIKRAELPSRCPLEVRS